MSRENDVAERTLGLSTAEALRRGIEVGPNTVDEKPESAVWRAAHHLWAPVPWMLETAVALELSRGETLEAAMIGTLLLLNVILGLAQESRATSALRLLKQHLAFKTRVRRDGRWCDLPAAALVPGDAVQLSLGNVVPADLEVISGSALVDQSALTGESALFEVQAGDTLYAGALVRRGEATGRVTATGPRTYFGRTIDLVQTARVESAEQRAVLDVVRNLTILNGAIIVAMVAYACWIGLPPSRLVPLVLAALLSAVPVALPATFTLAAAIGAKALAEHGVLLTRLSTLQDAATVDVLCVDKTGTLTDSTLVVSHIESVGGYGEDDVLSLGVLASSEDGQDPVDAALRARFRATGAKSDGGPRPLDFTPFDPATKVARARALVGGREFHVIKGAPHVVRELATGPRAQATPHDGGSAYRRIAVAAGPREALEVVGYVDISDSPRSDSSVLLDELHALGVRPIMLTGDSASTAAAVARAIGLEGRVCPASAMSGHDLPEDFSVYAGVFPEQKFRLIRGFQRQGHSVGMCGDGVNDAPALRQAQMGIAVATATDVAKAAAGMVLTAPGLGGIVTAIKEGRSAFQRVLTYTTTVLVNKSATLLVLAAGLVMTGQAILTPLLQALAMLAGDFMTMARAADKARPSPYPNAWQIRNLTIATLPLGVFKFLYCLGILSAAWNYLRLTSAQMQTLTFVVLVFAGQANAYVLRERGHFWSSLPARPMLVASVADVLAVCVLAGRGILMAPLPRLVLGAMLAATTAYAFAMDFIKLAAFSRIPVDRRVAGDAPTPAAFSLWRRFSLHSK